jgi:hypothetical protein
MVEKIDEYMGLVALGGGVLAFLAMLVIVIIIAIKNFKED